VCLAGFVVHFTNAVVSIHVPMKISARLFKHTLAPFARQAALSSCSYAAILVVVLSLGGGLSRTALAQDYLVANDDSFTSGVSFYSIGADGTPTFAQHVAGPGLGISGGFFGMNRLATVNIGSTQCIFASEAFTSDIMGIVAGSSVAAGAATGSATDTGSSNGIGLAANKKYLYASFSDSSTIGTFAIEPGCLLTFVNDVAVSGLNGGIVDGLAIHKNMLIATYLDGSIESFNVASGTPVSNGDKQMSTGSVGGETYPNGIDITQDGHFAIFGDTSTNDVVEVSDISLGRLAPTTVYQTHSGISSSNVLLSPDETILYISNTQGDVVTAAFFDKNTGVITRGCKSASLKDYVSGWSYLGALALQQITGNGGGVYVAEFGAPSGIAVLNLELAGSSCTLKEAPGSPVPDEYSRGLLSVGRFPPRSF
jgi:6-phosphogluconolactonase (cycloisomerase 2 family)